MRQQFPGARLDVRRVLSDGDLVLLHSIGVLVPGAPGMAVFDIVGFQDGKIAEHWDVLQEVLDSTANGNDMFSTLSQLKTEASVSRGASTIEYWHRHSRTVVLAAPATQGIQR